MPSTQVMTEFKRGNLHSGKGGPIVKKRNQAIAIMMSERRTEGLATGSKRPKRGNSPMPPSMSAMSGGTDRSNTTQPDRSK